MSASTRPSGTVTFLFTDIEGSTRRWEADADAMRAALAAARRGAAICDRGQRWVAVQAHRRRGVRGVRLGASRGRCGGCGTATLGLPVRMGIATGEAEQRGDDYFGPALNRAARVMAVGHGGQVLVTNSTAARPYRCRSARPRRASTTGSLRLWSICSRCAPTVWLPASRR